MQIFKKVNIIICIIWVQTEMKRENPLALLERVLWFVLKQIRILYHRISF
jgi:hypothetical protein